MKRLALFVALVVTLAGCNSISGTPTRPTDTPTIGTFVITPASGPAGTTSTLTWSVSPDTTHVSIAASVGVNLGTGFATTGTLTVNPASTTVYTLTAQNPRTGGSVFATASFTVK